MVLSTALFGAMQEVCETLNKTNVKWLLGGSCGLLLQDVVISSEPRDVDIYIDAGDADEVFQCLCHFATDALHFSETGIYRSTLSHYNIQGIPFELVGGFQVNALHSRYTVEAEYLYLYHAHKAAVGRHHAFLMPLAHELLFNVLRGRPDRYEAIAAKMEEQLDEHLPVLKDIMKRNSWGEAVIGLVYDLLKAVPM